MRDARLPLALTALAFALRLALMVVTEIYPDEAYYWVWAQHPALSYFDHPGLVAWSISLFGIRPTAMLFGVITVLGVRRLATSVGASNTEAAWATALFSLAPASMLLGTFTTPDAPLLAGWVWTMAMLVERRAVLAGLCWGLAMLGKYNGLFLGLPVLIAFWRMPRKLLIAGLIGLVLSLPTLVWNAQHDFVGFRFQYTHGLDGRGGPAMFVEFIGGQFLMAGPIFLVAVLTWLGTKRAPNLLLKAPTRFLILFFGLATFRARGESNWTAAAWLTGAVGVAMLTPRWRLVSAWSNAVVVTGAALVLAFAPSVAWRTPAIQKLHGWEALRWLGPHALPVFTDRYQLSALITYATQLPAGTFWARPSQYDLWPPLEVPPGSDALWVSEGAPPPEGLVERFEAVTQLEWPHDERQAALHPFVAYRLLRAKPLPLE